MSNKNLGIALVIMGGIAIFSDHEGAWIFSAICVGVGSGLFLIKR